MEFRYDHFEKSEHIFNLEHINNIKIKLKSSKTDGIAYLSFLNESDKDIPIPDEITIDGIDSIDNKFILLTTIPRYGLKWNGQVILNIHNTVYVEGYVNHSPCQQCCNIKLD